MSEYGEKTGPSIGTSPISSIHYRGPLMAEENSSLPRIRQITIEQLDYGYVVRVGCQTFACPTASFILSNLEKYLANPQEVEKNWMKDKQL